MHWKVNTKKIKDTEGNIQVVSPESQALHEFKRDICQLQESNHSLKNHNIKLKTNWAQSWHLGRPLDTHKQPQNNT